MQPHHALLTFLLTVAVHAQGANSLIGLTRGATVLNQRGHASCTQQATCTITGLTAPVAAWAGGSAWDPGPQIVWVSNGTQIAAIVPGTCVQYCAPQPAPLSSPNAVVTGLEIVESRSQLWMLDSLGVLNQCVITCLPTVQATCNTNLPVANNLVTGGLAVDECHGVVFYSQSNWLTNATTVYMAAIASPCQVFAQVPLPVTCFNLRAITGLAADGCRGILYLTDGDTTVAWPYTVAAGPAVTFATSFTCCNLPAPGGAANTLVGLAVRTGAPTSIGTPCVNGSCPNCPMTHALRTSPNLGNSGFVLDVTGASFSTFIWCVVGLGPCVPTAPVIPPLCGPVLTGPTLATLGPFGGPVGGGCYVYAPFYLPLPMNRNLCGMVLSSQAVALCPNPLGTALSNCLSWELQSN